MSVEELMEPPVYSVLSALAEESTRDEWLLTADAFIKFQVRRQGVPAAGQEPMKKNMLKLLGKLGEGLDVDGLMQDTVSYIRYTLWTSEIYVLYSTEVKDGIIENARAACAVVKEEAEVAKTTQTECSSAPILGH